MSGPVSPSKPNLNVYPYKPTGGGPSEPKPPKTLHPPDTMESLEKKGDGSPASSTGSGGSISTISTHSVPGSAVQSYASASDGEGRDRTLSQIFKPTTSPTPPGEGLPPAQDSPT